MLTEKQESNHVIIGFHQKYGALSNLTVGNGLARSVGEAALVPGSNMRKWGGFAHFTLFIPFGPYQMPLRGRNEQARSLRALR